MAHPNLELLQRMDEAMLKEDLETFFASYTDDVVVHVGGASPLAGDYEGLDQLQALFGRYMDLSGAYTFENHAYLADDDHGVILQLGTMRKGDETFSTNEAFVMHFRDGKISEFWYVPLDQAGLDAWFAR